VEKRPVDPKGSWVMATSLGGAGSITLIGGDSLSQHERCSQMHRSISLHNL